MILLFEITSGQVPEDGGKTLQEIRGAKKKAGPEGPAFAAEI